MSRPFLLIGHRGARGLFPENTAEGFAAAEALGIDGIELDIALTADGVAVVSHDPALNPDIVRGPDGAWRPGRGPLIHRVSEAELGGYDVGRLRPGSSTAARFPAQVPIDGARIPRLDTSLCLPGLHYVLEMKTFPDHPDWTASAVAMAEATIAVVDRLGLADRVTLESFDWRGPRHVRRVRPDLRLAWLTTSDSVAAARLWWDGSAPSDYGGSIPRAVAAEGGPVWAPDHATLTGDEVAEAHALGLSVLPWTVNEAEDMARLIGWGVDGLISDRPDIARRVMAAAGFALPPPRQVAFTPVPADSENSPAPRREQGGL